MYSHGYYVVTLWDRSWERVGPKLCGFYADNQLLGCGDYVDFVPRKLPHIVCPAIVQQHRTVVHKLKILQDQTNAKNHESLQ